MAGAAKRVEPTEVKVFRESEREQIQRELAGLITGFDVLVEQRKQNLISFGEALIKNPDMTRREASQYLKCSMRTVTRYLAELRKGDIFKKSIVVDKIKQYVKDKEVRKSQLRKLMSQQPDVPFVEHFRTIGVCDKTGYQYLRELER